MGSVVDRQNAKPLLPPEQPEIGRQRLLLELMERCSL